MERLLRQPLLAMMGLGLALAGPLAGAHHALDPSNWTPIEWIGNVELVSWDGAHVMYRIEVEDAAGATRSWQVLGASPKILMMRNIRKSTVQVGERITVIGHLDPLSKIIAPQFFVTADGRRHEMGFYPQPAAYRMPLPAR